MVSKPHRCLILFLIVFISCFQEPIYSQKNRNIPVVNFMQFEPQLHFSNDTTYIVNFWATWCVPCRKELPYFEKIHNEYADQKVKVTLVSLDFSKNIESSLVPFLNKNSITADVLLLDDPNSNAWIDKVDPSWSGSLPATLIYNRMNRKFFEQELDYQSIQNTIIEINNN